MTWTEMIDAAEANIRADYRARRISKEQFLKEMLIVARARQHESDAAHARALLSRLEER